MCYYSNMHKHNRGFTIVELLIVIVVIAILASITLVSYSGIRERAHNVVILSAVDSWVELLSASYVLNGTVAINFAPDHGGGICLGDPADYPAISQLAKNECYPDYFADQEIQDKLSSVGNASMKTYPFDIGNGSYTRGVQYTFEGDGHAYVHYDLVGTGQKCALSGAASIGDTINTKSTDCKIDMTEKLGGPPLDFNWAN